MEDRLELSRGVVALLVGGVVVLGLIVVIATSSGGGDKEAKLSDEEQSEFDRFIDHTIVDLTFSQSPVRKPPASLLEALVTELIPNYAMRLDDVKAGTSEEDAKRMVDVERRAVLSDRLKHVLDQGTVSTLAGVLKRALLLQIHGGGSEYVDALDSAVIAFNNRMIGAGHRFVIHSYVNSRGTVWLLGYAVDQVATYSAGAHAVKAIRARRLDRLNFHATAQGFASPTRELAWVRTSTVEETLVSTVLPQLGADKRPYYDMDERFDTKKPWFKTANERAARLFRRDYAELMVDPAAAKRLGELLALRIEVLSRWHDLRAGFKRTAERMVRTLSLSRRFKNVLRGFPRADLLELMSIESELAGERMRKAFKAAMEIAMRTVEHHEVQHRLDYLRGEIKYPAELVPLVGALEAEDGTIRRFPRSVNMELSAMLSELARAGSRAASELSFQMMYLIKPGLWRSQYSKGISVIIDALATDLSVKGGPIRFKGALRRERAVKLFVGLTNKKGDELAAAAKRVWERLYAAPLLSLKRSVQ